MAADRRTSARNGAALGNTRVSVTARKQPDQKAKGQPGMLVNLRIVMSATAVTIFLLLVGFGGLGALFIARTSPPAQIANGHILDFSPPTVAQKFEPPVKTTKTERIVPLAVEPTAPPAAVTVVPSVPEALPQPETAAAPTAPAPQTTVAAETADPVTTGAIPDATKQNVAPVARPWRQKKARVVQRAAPAQKTAPPSTNPFSQLFGRQYK